MARTLAAARIDRDAERRLRAFRDEVARAFPGALAGMILFGSRARGDAREDSDYDVAVLLRGGLADDWRLRRKLADMTFDHMLAGTRISPIALDADEYQEVGGRTRFELARRIARDGIAIA
jgi:predicted nucleotidyltransferase